MEDITADVGENIKETTDKPSPDAEANVKVNGDVNGSADEAMVVDTPTSPSASPESSTNRDPQDKEDEANKEDESMEVDNNASDVPSDLSVKSDVHGDSDGHTDGLSKDNVKNGPSATEGKVRLEGSISASEDIDTKSEQSDIRDDVKLDNVDNNVSAGKSASSESVKKDSASDSEQDDEDQPKSPSLQNGETAAENSTDNIDGDEAKDLSKDSLKDEETPERGDSERTEGDGEESPDGSTPTKKGKGRKNPAPLSLTPRRSSRNLNKQKSYAEDKEEVPERDDGSDIEEIAVTDPLAGTGDQQNKENSKSRGGRSSTSSSSSSNKTIVVNDTKHLVEIASGSKPSKGQKKEPTLDEAIKKQKLEDEEKKKEEEEKKKDESKDDSKEGDEKKGDDTEVKEKSDADKSEEKMDVDGPEKKSSKDESKEKDKSEEKKEEKKDDKKEENSKETSKDDDKKPQSYFENPLGKFFIQIGTNLVQEHKKYRPEKNQEPPLDWEPPAKIPRVSRSRPFPMGSQSVAGMTVPPKAGMVGQQHPLLPKLPVGSSIVGQPSLGQMANSLVRGRGRPPVTQARYPDLKQSQAMQQQQRVQTPMSGMMYRPSPSGPSQVLVPTSYQIAGNPIYQNSKGQASKLQQQPSISITPLPRQSSGTPPNAHSTGVATGANKPGNPSSGGKATYVICEICDGYIKDLEQLRNHMQWIHKVKIHPKMIYNRPPLNCQKCQFRFFTDQGLERHLLGSHGLVTSSMQEAANKGKDGGRCPVCGRVYQWKLLNHVARDHSMTLKPAHLSYKCTVCTATFGMYKQFENHVYSAHSVVAKRVMDKKPGAGTTSTSSPSVSRSPAPSQGDSLLIKPLKINDEITIIPQPTRGARPAAPAGRSGPLPAHMQGGKAGDDRQRRPGGDDGVQIIDLDGSPPKDALSAVQERLKRRTSLEVSQVEAPEDDGSSAAKRSRRD
ncbi:hypothetical protein ONE63_001139 [Megalurothrips usitatus]|uniref:MOG interacting and ectopic P-granules protein 1 n=1 Tax=Megalurothrips usitatus TaxID=439358 RepID=A0AAV7XB96_9NEOP|nr:hypothetical protein ONE63_001139 [Megalurothrips usitatus]